MQRATAATAARIAAAVLFYFSAVVFALSLLLVVFADVVARNGGEQLAQLLSNRIPGATLRTGAVGLDFSLSGVHLRAEDFALTYENSHFAARRADFWLEEDGQLKIALRAATLTLAAVQENENHGDETQEESNRTPLLPAWAFEFSAPDAHLALPDAGITLTQAQLVARGDEDGWRANLSQGKALHLRAGGDAQRITHLYAVVENFAPPPHWAQHYQWQNLRATVHAQQTADGMQARAHGGFSQLIAATRAVTLSDFNWQAHATCPALTACMREMYGQVSLRGQVAPAAVSLHLANGGWRKQGAQWQVFAPELQLNAGTTQWQGRVHAQVHPVARRVSLHAAAALPHQPASTITLHADGHWRQLGADNWHLFAREVQLAHAGAALRGQAVWQVRPTLTAYALTGGAPQLDLTSVARTLPAGGMQRWWERSILGGALVQAQLTLAMPVNAPDVGRRVQLHGNLQDATLHIASGWADAQALQGTLQLEGEDLHIYGRGMFDGLSVTAVHAHLPALYSSAQNSLLLTLHSDAAPVSVMFAAARRNPVTRGFMQQAEAELELKNRGRGQLYMQINVPLATPKEAQVRATLAVQHGAVQAGNLPMLEDLRGTLHFGNRTYGGTLNGRLPEEEEEEAEDAPRITAIFAPAQLTLQGVTEVSLLLAAAGMRTAPVSGVTPFTVSRSSAGTLFFASLEGAVIDLPAPLGKGGFEAATISAQLTDNAAEVHYHGRMITLHIQQQGEGTDIAINSRANAPPTSGINLHGRASSLNLDLWLAQTGGGGAHLATLQLTLQDAEFTGIPHQRFVVHGGSGGAGQPLSLRLDATHGRGSVVFAEQRLQGAFDLLSIPLGTDASGGGSGEGGGQLASLTLELSANTLVVGGLTLGALTLAGAPQGEVWNINTLRVATPHTTMHIGGTYEEAHTYLTMHLEVGDLPALMTILQIPQVFGGGRVTAFGSFGWQGAPTDFSPAKVVGDMRLLGEGVQYLAVDFSTDVVNFLSIFSPQSLFSLGFTDLVRGGGVIFDSVQGDVKLTSGEAQFLPIVLISRDLRMDIQGSTDFVHRRYNIHGRVQPGEKLVAAGSAVGIGTGLAVLNPATFVAGSLLGKIFEKPLSEIGAYDYTITGTWEDPEYKELGVLPPPEPEDATQN